MELVPVAGTLCGLSLVRAARCRWCGGSYREMLHHSAYARLQARQETLAVIEQAKGIIMAQRRCGPDEAFDLLRRASQRVNIKLHVLAAQIVEHIASSDNCDNVTPISLGATWHRRSETPTVTSRLVSETPSRRERWRS